MRNKDERTEDRILLFHFSQAQRRMRRRKTRFGCWRTTSRSTLSAYYLLSLCHLSLLLSPCSFVSSVRLWFVCHILSHALFSGPLPHLLVFLGTIWSSSCRIPSLASSSPLCPISALSSMEVRGAREIERERENKMERSRLRTRERHVVDLL